MMGKKTWLAFLDLQKAFPSEWRKGLWTKMKGYTLGNKIFRVLETINANTCTRVRIGALFLDNFEIPMELREGCVLSPLLFSIFILDLAEELEKSGLGVKIEGHWMELAFFANDIVLFADSEKALQRMLDW